MASEPTPRPVDDRVAEVAALIDRLRFHPDIGPVSAGQYIAAKLDEAGYLATEPEYGLRDYEGNISIHPEEEARGVDAAFTDYSLLFRHVPKWLIIDQ